MNRYNIYIDFIINTGNIFFLLPHNSNLHQPVQHSSIDVPFLPGSVQSPALCQMNMQWSHHVFTLSIFQVNCYWFVWWNDQHSTTFLLVSWRVSKYFIIWSREKDPMSTLIIIVIPGILIKIPLPGWVVQDLCSMSCINSFALSLCLESNKQIGWLYVLLLGATTSSNMILNQLTVLHDMQFQMFFFLSAQVQWINLAHVIHFSHLPSCVTFSIFMCSQSLQM